MFLNNIFFSCYRRKPTWTYLPTRCCDGREVAKHIIHPNLLEDFSSSKNLKKSQILNKAHKNHQYMYTYVQLPILYLYIYIET